MSVVVEIDIADGNAYRQLVITNISQEIERDGQGWRSQDQVCEYRVERRVAPGTNIQKSATFMHRYGDDVTVLIAKAGEALRIAHGHA